MKNKIFLLFLVVSFNAIAETDSSLEQQIEDYLSRGYTTPLRFIVTMKESSGNPLERARETMSEAALRSKVGIELLDSSSESILVKPELDESSFSKNVEGKEIIEPKILNQAIAVAEALEKDPNVESVEVNHIYQLTESSLPNDELYSQQWSLFSQSQQSPASIEITQAWRFSEGKDVVVAVLDTGIVSHSDLNEAQILNRADFITDDKRSRDYDGGRDLNPTDEGDWVEFGDCYTNSPHQWSSWHGNHVAGIIAAKKNNRIGISGVAPGVKLIIGRVVGRCGADGFDIGDAIEWAIGEPVEGVPVNPYPAKIVNMSFAVKLKGKNNSYPKCPHSLQKSINKGLAKGVIFVTGAGNDAGEAEYYAPGMCNGVITVAATTKQGGRASYTNVGNVVDVAAPGGDIGEGEGILSLSNTGTTTPVAGGETYRSEWGTSQAAPHVAGIAALMAGVNSNITAERVEKILKDTVTIFPAREALGTTPCVKPYCGKGIVHAGRAVEAARAAPRSSVP